MPVSRTAADGREQLAQGDANPAGREGQPGAERAGAELGADEAGAQQEGEEGIEVDRQLGEYRGDRVRDRRDDTHLLEGRHLRVGEPLAVEVVLRRIRLRLRLLALGDQLRQLDLLLLDLLEVCEPASPESSAGRRCRRRSR